MSTTVSIARAKARFAETVRRAERGEVVILTRHGRPVARLAPLESAAAGDSGARAIREPETPYESLGREEQSVLYVGSRREELERLLESAVWPRVPGDQLGKPPDRREREAILGHGEDGV